MTNNLNLQINHLVLSMDVNQEGLWDRSNLQPRQFISQCCQALVDSSGSDYFCTDCGEDLTPSEILDGDHDLIPSDFAAEAKDLFDQIADFN